MTFFPLVVQTLNIVVFSVGLYVNDLNLDYPNWILDFPNDPSSA